MYINLWASLYKSLEISPITCVTTAAFSTFYTAQVCKFTCILGNTYIGRIFSTLLYVSLFFNFRLFSFKFQNLNCMQHYYNFTNYLNCFYTNLHAYPWKDGIGNRFSNTEQSFSLLSLLSYTCIFEMFENGC